MRTPSRQQDPERADGLLRRDPEAFLAWLDHRWGIFAPGERDDPAAAHALWADIQADPLTSARYHWRRMFGCAVGILTFAVLGMSLAAASRWLIPLHHAWPVPMIIAGGFLLLVIWRTTLSATLDHGHRIRIPRATTAGWPPVLIATLLATALAAPFLTPPR